MEFQKVSKNCLTEWYILRIFTMSIFVLFTLILAIIPANDEVSIIIKTVILIIVGMITLFFAIYALIFPSMQYKRLKYKITSSKIEKHSGVIFLRKQFIPFVRIQHVETYRGVMDRIFKMSTVIIYTAGSVLRIQNLDIIQADELIVHIRKILSEVEGTSND